MEVTRIFDLPYFQAKKYPKTDALCGKENGVWKKFSTQEFIENTNAFSSGLLSMGFKPGDKIGTISNNRPEWNFADMGMLQIGVIHVPIYPTISEHDFEFIIKDAELKMLLISDEELFSKVSGICKNINSTAKLFTFNKINGANHWVEILSAGKDKSLNSKVEEIKSSIKPKDLATILYTSGTTGNPKGVMLSHHNLVSDFLAVRHSTPVDNTCKAISFLPLNHVYERMLTYLYMYLGVSIYYAESIETIGDNIREVHPQVFSAVPRLLEKVFAKIMAKGEELTGIKRKLFFWAVNLGLEYEFNKENGIWYEFMLSIANKIIFNKWREALGGNVKAIVSGGAALNPKLARVFWAAKIPVLEGYGLTETSPVLSVNNVVTNEMHFGTVGTVIEGVQIKIAEDGEILAKGPNLMMGYYKRDDLTNEVIDKDGWFHTGDIGEFVKGKYLRLTDRKKEMFKTSTGKYIAPQQIENQLKESPYIEQVMVVGENEKYAAALIVPSFENLKIWCEKHHINTSNVQTMLSEKAVYDLMSLEIDKINLELGKSETIKKFALLEKEWTIDGGELTPKLSLKRKAIYDKYRDTIAGLFEKSIL